MQIEPQIPPSNRKNSSIDNNFFDPSEKILFSSLTYNRHSKNQPLFQNYNRKSPTDLSFGYKTLEIEQGLSNFQLSQRLQFQISSIFQIFEESLQCNQIQKDQISSNEQKQKVTLINNRKKATVSSFVSLGKGRKQNKGLVLMTRKQKRSSQLPVHVKQFEKNRLVQNSVESLSQKLKKIKDKVQMIANCLVNNVKYLKQSQNVNQLQSIFFSLESVLKRVVQGMKERVIQGMKERVIQGMKEMGDDFKRESKESVELRRQWKERLRMNSQVEQKCLLQLWQILIRTFLNLTLYLCQYSHQSPIFTPTDLIESQSTSYQLILNLKSRNHLFLNQILTQPLLSISQKTQLTQIQKLNHHYQNKGFSLIQQFYLNTLDAIEDVFRMGKFHQKKGKAGKSISSKDPMLPVYNQIISLILSSNLPFSPLIQIVKQSKYFNFGSSKSVEQVDKKYFGLSKSVEQVDKILRFAQNVEKLSFIIQLVSNNERKQTNKSNHCILSMFSVENYHQLFKIFKQLINQFLVDKNRKSKVENQVQRDFGDKNGKTMGQFLQQQNQTEIKDQNQVMNDQNSLQLIKLYNKRKKQFVFIYFNFIQKVLIHSYSHYQIYRKNTQLFHPQIHNISQSFSKQFSDSDSGQHLTYGQFIFQLFYQLQLQDVIGQMVVIGEMVVIGGEQEVDQSYFKSQGSIQVKKQSRLDVPEYPYSNDSFVFQRLTSLYSNIIDTWTHFLQIDLAQNKHQAKHLIYYNTSFQPLLSIITAHYSIHPYSSKIYQNLKINHSIIPELYNKLTQFQNLLLNSIKTNTKQHPTISHQFISYDSKKEEKINVSLIKLSPTLLNLIIQKQLSAINHCFNPLRIPNQNQDKQKNSIECSKQQGIGQSKRQEIEIELQSYQYQHEILNYSQNSNYHILTQETKKDKQYYKSRLETIRGRQKSIREVIGVIERGDSFESIFKSIRKAMNSKQIKVQQLGRQKQGKQQLSKRVYLRQQEKSVQLDGGIQSLIVGMKQCLELFDSDKEYFKVLLSKIHSNTLLTTTQFDNNSVQNINNTVGVYQGYILLMLGVMCHQCNRRDKVISGDEQFNQLTWMFQSLKIHSSDMFLQTIQLQIHHILHSLIYHPPYQHLLNHNSLSNQYTPNYSYLQESYGQIQNKQLVGIETMHSFLEMLVYKYFQLKWRQIFVKKDSFETVKLPLILHLVNKQKFHLLRWEMLEDDRQEQSEEKQGRKKEQSEDKWGRKNEQIDRKGILKQLFEHLYNKIILSQNKGEQKFSEILQMLWGELGCQFLRYLLQEKRLITQISQRGVLRRELVVQMVENNLIIDPIDSLLPVIKQIINQDSESYCQCLLTYYHSNKHKHSPNPNLNKHCHSLYLHCLWDYILYTFSHPHQIHLSPLVSDVIYFHFEDFKSFILTNLTNQNCLQFLHKLLIRYFIKLEYDTDWGRLKNKSEKVGERLQRIMYHRRRWEAMVLLIREMIGRNEEIFVNKQSLYQERSNINKNLDSLDSQDDIYRQDYIRERQQDLRQMQQDMRGRQYDMRGRQQDKMGRQQDKMGKQGFRLWGLIGVEIKQVFGEYLKMYRLFRSQKRVNGLNLSLFFLSNQELSHREGKHQLSIQSQTIESLTIESLRIESLRIEPIKYHILPFSILISIITQLHSIIIKHSQLLSNNQLFSSLNLVVRTLSAEFNPVEMQQIMGQVKQFVQIQTPNILQKLQLLMQKSQLSTNNHHQPHSYIQNIPCKTHKSTLINSKLKLTYSFSLSVLYQFSLNYIQSQLLSYNLSTQFKTNQLINQSKPFLSFQKNLLKQFLSSWQTYQLSINLFAQFTAQIQSLAYHTQSSSTYTPKRSNISSNYHQKLQSPNQHPIYQTKTTFFSQLRNNKIQNTKYSYSTNNQDIQHQSPIVSYLTGLNDLQVTRKKLSVLLALSLQQISLQIQTSQDLAYLLEYKSSLVVTISQINTVTDLINALNGLNSFFMFLSQKNYQINPSLKEVPNYFIRNVHILKSCIIYHQYCINLKSHSAQHETINPNKQFPQNNHRFYPYLNSTLLSENLSSNHTNQTQNMAQQSSNLTNKTSNQADPKNDSKIYAIDKMIGRQIFKIKPL